MDERSSISDEPSSALSSSSSARDGDEGSQEQTIEPSDLYSEIEALNGTVEELEQKIRELQRQLANKEHNLNELKREVEGNSDAMSRLKAERRKLEEEKNHLISSLQHETHKNTMLFQNRSKLEQSVSDLEESLLAEKRQLSVANKNVRKYELELQTHESEREEYDKKVKELEARLKHKDENIGSLKDILEEKNVGQSSTMRKLSDLQNEYEELEQRLEDEKELRMKSERRNTEHELEIRELEESMQELQRSNNSNSELSRRREGEVEKIRYDMRELSEIHEKTLAQLKQKHQLAVEEMAKQLDQTYADKSKSDKLYHELSYKLAHLETEYEHVEKEKVKCKALSVQLEAGLDESNKEIERLSHRCDEQASQKKKVEGELKRNLDEIDEYRNQISSLSKAKQLLQDHLEVARHQLNEENREKVAATAELRNALIELDSIKTQLEDELEVRGELDRELVVLTNTAENYRKKYENERFERMREIEEVRSKLESKLAEMDDQLEQATSKSMLLQRSKEKLQQEVEDMVGAIDKANTIIANLERKQKRFDRLIDEWKTKCETISMELAAAQNNAKFLGSEAQKKQDQYLEAQDEIESLRRENRNLSDEVKSLMEQMENDATSAFEFEKAKQKLEKEKEELRSKMEYCVLEREECELRVQAALNDLDASRREYEMAIGDLQDDMDASKRNSQLMVQMIQENLNAEVSAKREAIAQKDEALSVADNLRAEVDASEQRSAELKLRIDSLLHMNDELKNGLEDERQRAQMARDAEIAAGKRNRALIAEVEHVKENLFQVEKEADTLRANLTSVINSKNELNTQLQSVYAQKSHVDTVLAKLQIDHDSALSEIRVLDERCNKLTSENHAFVEKSNMERSHLSELDGQLSDLKLNLTAAENKAEVAASEAFKHFKNVIQTLEDRILEKDNDIQVVAHKYDEAQRQIARVERRMRELAKQNELLNGQNEKLHDLNESVQQKLKNFRRQSDQAEQEASQCLARYKVMADDLSRAQQRAHAAEQMINKYRATSRFNYATAKIPSREMSVPVFERDHTSVSNRNI